MTDLELAALTAVVARETIISEHELKNYGACQCDPRTAAMRALRKELERRRVIPLTEYEAGKSAMKR